ncbi:MAG: 5'-nucleotidase C-terminal domain-containing protein [Holophagales bacterium]|nr:5'-nucleotidase C-terminal domain-containing protein [Holophagales bacterium]
MSSAKSLTVLQLNDSHANFDLHQEVFWEGGRAVYRPAGGYARIAAVVKEVRAANPGGTLFCDCGDTFHGTYPVMETRGAALVPVLNALGLDAMTAHWEFAYGPGAFKELAAELSFPMLAMNVYDKETRARPFPPYRVVERGGCRVGLAGIASNIVDKTMPPSFSEGLEFTLGLDELPGIIDVLRTREKVDLVLLVSHLGLPQDLKLLSAVPGVDVCLSGHTHNRLFTPVLQGKTLVIQSGCHGSFLGRLDLEVDGGRIVEWRHELMEVKAGVRPDPEVDLLVRHTLAPWRDMLSEVVGETATALNRATMLESTMDNFLLQALLESTGAQLAFSNGWRFGAPIPAGEVTVNDLYNMIPMDPPVSTVELRGDEIVAMLEENLERTFGRDPYDQMGGYVKRSLGLNAFIKIENPPGQRVQQVFVGGDRLQSGRHYPTVFVTEQGVARKYGRNRQKHAERSIGALRAYLAKHRPLHAELRGTFVAV